MRARRALCVALAVGLLGSCGGGGDDRVAVVASFYPVAWAAAEVGGGRVRVEDLTPPGGEAHDATLSAAQRAALTTAPVVLLLGRFGFQPEVERAAADAEGRVVEVAAGLDLLPGQGDLRSDPHVWLDPVLMRRIVGTVVRALAAADPSGADAYRRRGAALEEELGRLDAAYRDGLADCEYRTFVVSHEAFGYLAARYGLRELGILGLQPEGEPSASRIEAAIAAIRSGEAAPVVFREATEVGRRIAGAVAADAGVPTLPLSTLESRPPAGDYLSAMRANLATLREGLRCR
ncbi:MAG TPA: metal ABC transporter substrate-binding protein [Actinomycetota bacterium]|nr:metal ABC transporter substrate-binding protein [Actinomycetota bacterium]